MMHLSRETGQELCDLIHRLCGLVLGQKKDYLIRHQLEPLVRREGLAGFDQLLEFLRSRGGARLHNAIVEAITTKETSFFRDPPFYEALRRVVLPEFVEFLQRRVGRRHQIRIWSAACSTGQEPYSLAILIRDYMAEHSAEGVSEKKFTILASDISAEAIDAAKTARYTANETARGLSADTLSRHFRRDAGKWVVNETLRRFVQFQRADLLQPPSQLGAFDLILCRNLLIYFDEETRRHVCKRLYGLLQNGGWLAVGAAESLFGLEEQFETVRIGRVLLYRKPPSNR